MVNENHDTFIKEQRDLKNQYLGGTKSNNKPAASDPEYNNPGDTNQSPGTTGRNL
jgi:hypothetical protein